MGEKARAEEGQDVNIIYNQMSFSRVCAVSVSTKRPNNYVAKDVCLEEDVSNRDARRQISEESILAGDSNFLPHGRNRTAAGEMAGQLQGRHRRVGRCCLDAAGV